MTIEERIDRIELCLSELQQRVDRLTEVYEQLLAIGITLDAKEIKTLQQQIAKASFNLDTRQN